jgi:hypothetical protein
MSKRKEIFGGSSWVVVYFYKTCVICVRRRMSGTARPTLLLRRIPVENFPTLVEIRDTLQSLGLVFSRYRSKSFIDHFEYRPYDGSQIVEYKFGETIQEQDSPQNIMGASAEVID